MTTPPDDDEDMTQEQEAPSRPAEKTGGIAGRKILKRLLKIGLWLAALLFVAFTALANLGGTGDIFRESLEKYLNDSTPYTASVQRLNGLYFFPEIALDVEGVELRDPGTQETAISISRVRLATGFFDVMFGRQRYRILEIEGLHARSGSVLDKPLDIGRIDFREEGPEKAFLVATGKIGEQVFAAGMEFRPEGKPGRRRYSPAADMEIRASLGGIALGGVLKKDPRGDLKLENFTLRQTTQAREALKGNFDLARLGGGRFTLKGRAEIEPHKTVLNPDIVFHMGARPAEIRGELRASPFNIADFGAQMPIAQVAKIWTEAFGPLGAMADLGLSLENFTVGGIDWGTVQAKLALDKGDLKIGPLSGKIMDGDLSGIVLLKSAANPVTLDAQIDIRNLDYALLQKRFDKDANIEGRADLWVDLGAKGEHLAALPAAMSGKITLVGGKGRIGLETLARWGEGLPGILMRDLPRDAALDLICAVADFDLKDAVARSGSIFIDTDQARMQGAGQYDFGTNLLEMTVNSRTGAKKAGQPASAHIKGPLAGLKASAGRFGASGSLARNATTPDFRPLSLPDRDLGADHPCKAFVIETEVLDAPVFGEQKQGEKK